MTKLEQSLLQSIIILLYEPEIIEGSEKYGDYGGLNIERRSCFKTPCDEDPFDPTAHGYELFITTINDQKYIGLYRTWIGDEYGKRDGCVEVLVSSNIGCFKYASQRWSEACRLIKEFSMFLSQLEEL